MINEKQHETGEKYEKKGMQNIEKRAKFDNNEVNPILFT